MVKRLLIATFIVLSFALTAISQNKFEGYNIILDVPETQQGSTCAIRYAPPTTSITIADMNPATAMSLRSCDGSATNLVKSSALTFSLKASGNDYKWCFQGEDKKYRISFNGDQYAKTVVYDWIATPDEKNLGNYNVRDFGAVGDGKTDDTIAIQSALAFIAVRNGGTLFFPEGDYQVGNVPNFKGLVLPSNTTIQGIGGLQSNAGTSDLPRKNPTRITMTVPNRALFRIGECMEKISIKDIELIANSQQNTFGVEALGAYSTSQDIYFENVTFHSFTRGIYAHGLPQTDLNWQFDYIQLDRCRFVFNTDAGIYTNIRNTDWRIQNSLFINSPRTATQKGDSMHFERAAGIYIDNTVGGGFSGAIGGTFLDILDSSSVLVSHSQTEAMTNSFVYNGVNNPYAGDYSAPVTFLNSAFGNPIIFNARRTFVSTGNAYSGNVFKADERLRVYSTGDRFCYDGYTLGCRGAAENSFDKATIIFMTGQPADGKVKGFPTIFGTDVQFGAPVQMPTFQQNTLPQGKGNGSLVYCANCRRSTTPCQGGGNGAPAMVVGGQWSCL
jgi:Pectate lyase superfamily protein